MLEQIGISIQQVARQAMNEDGQQIFEVFWQEEGKYLWPAGPDVKRNGKGLVDLERRCQDTSREILKLECDRRQAQSARHSE